RKSIRRSDKIKVLIRSHRQPQLRETEPWLYLPIQPNNLVHTYWTALETPTLMALLLATLRSEKPIRIQTLTLLTCGAPAQPLWTRPELTARRPPSRR